MAVREHLVEGWTERITEILKNDGVAINLTGVISVQIVLYDKTGALFAHAGSSGIVTAATGIVYFDPHASDLMNAKSPYRVRWKVIDGTGKIFDVPNGSADEWIVRKP